MRLEKVRVQNYRSIRDTGEFEIEKLKTIMVGPNEAGKSAILQALQQINAPAGVKGFNPLRDYPRALYNDITSKKIKPADIPVVTATFILDDYDLDEIPASWRSDKLRYVITRNLDNGFTHHIVGGPVIPYFSQVQSDLLRLAAHIDRTDPEAKAAFNKLSELTKGWSTGTVLQATLSAPLRAWLLEVLAQIDEDDEREVKRHEQIIALLNGVVEHTDSAKALKEYTPVFVLFSNYFRVKPNIHLAHLAERLSSGVMDDDAYDYGNSCLLKLLGFTAEALSALGSAAEPAKGDPAAWEAYRAQLDNRAYQLNAASIKLTDEITKVWNPDQSRGEASRLRIAADGQYLKVVVEDGVGVDVELDQRSEGFQWLVSFFIVFFAEQSGQHQNAILLLDEPGMSLHALKQREFRLTLTRLAEENQTIYTTHSPFMVGPDEMDLVRVVEMSDRKIGTKVHTTITSSDPAALLPLQEALGYDLAQSLFAQQRNLVLEGLTDLWYLEGGSALIGETGEQPLNPNIALITANAASKVVYYATILHAHNLKVSALLDSDNAGDTAATQEVLVHTLGQKRILRTADYAKPNVPKAEIEDVLRSTVVSIAKAEFGWDVEKEAADQPSRPIVDILTQVVGKADFSKYKLAKAFVRWSRDHTAADLSADEREGLSALIAAINSSLK